MLLKEVIAKVDKSKRNQQDVDVDDLEESLSNHFGISMSLDYSKGNTRVTACWLAYWYCTDTWVGFRVYFLDDNILAVSYQRGRKWDESFTFANSEIKKEFKEYLLSLAISNDKEEEEESYLDLQQDMQNGISVSFASELMATHVFYKDKLCKIIYPKGIHKNGKEYNKIYTNKCGDTEKIKVELSNGVEVLVELNDCVVPYNIK